MLIIDTSVMFEALVPGPSTPKARKVFASPELLVAPDLLAVEIAGALTRAVRRGVVPAPFAREAHRLAASLMPALDDVGPLLTRAFEMSLEIPHPLADCVFLADAEMRASRLVTGDRQLSRKVAQTPYRSLVVDLCDWVA